MWFRFNIYYFNTSHQNFSFKVQGENIVQKYSVKPLGVETLGVNVPAKIQISES